MPRTLTFTPTSPREALLVLEDDDGAFGLTRDPGHDHGLGLRESPRFLVRQPFSPDEAWAFEPRPAGRDVPDGWQPQDQAQRDLADWLSDSPARRGLSALPELPRGRYLLLRSDCTPGTPDQVLMGNELQPRPANVLVLRQEEPYSVIIVGSTPGQPPALDQPLLGLAVLNYVGTFTWQGLVLFTPAAHRPLSTLPRELLLVVPVDGELVIDNMEGFEPEWERISATRWRDRHVPALRSLLLRR